MTHRIKNITIRIDRMRCYSRHGVLAQENAVGTEYEVSVAIHYPAQTAVMYDTLADTIDYARMAEIITDVMAEPSKLLERVCGRIIEKLMLCFPLTQGGSVTVTKLAPPIAGTSMAGASVTVDW